MLRRSSLARLLKIVLELEGDRRPNSQRLAEVCEVSRRTIFRDLETIERAGVQVEYDAARLGYRLAAKVGLTYPPLSESEAMALFLLAQTWDKPDESGFASRAKVGALKLIQGLSPTSRTRLEAIVPTSSDQPPLHPLPSDRRVIYERLLEGILRGVQVGIKFRESTETVATSTMMTPYRLFRADGWQLIGHSSVHRDVRAIALASVDHIVVTDEPAIVPPRFRVVKRREHQSPKARIEVVLWLDPDSAPLLLKVGWTPSRWNEPSENGRVEMVVDVDRPNEFVDWCLGQGDRVEVRSPTSFRRKMIDAARKIARRYAKDEPEAASAIIENESDRRDSRFVSPPHSDFSRVGG